MLKYLLKIKSMNFTKYWEENKELYKQLGVTEVVARKIWNDCADTIEKKITEYYLSKLK